MLGSDWKERFGRGIFLATELTDLHGWGAGGRSDLFLGVGMGSFLATELTDLHGGGW